MPLPQQVIEQLSHEQTKTPGWSSGILLFSGTILVMILAIYVGLIFGYEPYLQGTIQQTQDQMNALSQSISSSDQAQLLTYYSQVVNLRSLVVNHVLFSQFLTWLEKNTEANIYYTNLDFTSGNNVSLTVFGKTQADVNQQIKLFESSPQVKGVSVDSILFSPSVALWTFNATLIVQPSLLAWNSAGGSQTSALPGTSTAATANLAAASTSVPANIATGTAATTTHK